jgi:hypothetical protein
MAGPQDGLPVVNWGNMSIPSVNRDSILEAMKVFDASHRDLPKWQGWENNDSFKYAIF